MSKRFPAKKYQIHFRVDQKEYESIKKNAARAGLTISQFARKAMAGDIIVEAPPADLNYLLREMKRAGSNLHQVLRKLNILGIAHSLELERCAADIRDTMNLIYQTYWPENKNNKSE